MDDYQPLTLRRLLGPTGAEQLEEVLTDHAIAHQRDGVATDARGYARSKVQVVIEIATDTSTGHIRAEIRVSGGLAKLKGLVVPMRMQDGVLLVESFEDEEEPQIQLPGVKDPGLEAREAMAAERRRERAIDVGERRREPVAEEDDPEDEAPQVDPIDFPTRQRRDATA